MDLLHYPITLPDDSLFPAEESLPALLRRKPSLDEVEVFLMAQGGNQRPVGEDGSLPVKHHFTPGLYCREIFMPAGAVLTSMIHNTEHPFVVSQGRCSVYNEGTGETMEIVAPHFGITLPGTRRLLFIHEDTIWTTFHVTHLKDVAEIEKAILKPHSNPLLAAQTSNRRQLK
jgi:hypothetical protein